MKEFAEKHRDRIVGAPECFDRILLKGHLPLPTGKSLESLLDSLGLLYKDFEAFVLKHSQYIKDHARQAAERSERPFEPIPPRVRKEDRAPEIAKRDGITQGLLCIYTAAESCSSFVLRAGKGKPRLHRARRRNPPRRPPTLGEMMVLVAQVGGYIPRKSSDPPGPQTVWPALQRAYDFALCWGAFGPKK